MTTHAEFFNKQILDGIVTETVNKGCNLAGCVEPIKFLEITIDKKTHEVNISYSCKYDYPEAWDMEGLGCAVVVFRISDWNQMKKRDRIFSKEHRYKK